MNRSSDEGLQKLNGKKCKHLWSWINLFYLQPIWARQCFHWSTPPLCIHQQLIEWNPPQCQHLQTQSNIQCRTFQRKFTLGFDFFNLKAVQWKVRGKNSFIIQIFSKSFEFINFQCRVWRIFEMNVWTINFVLRQPTTKRVLWEIYRRSQLYKFASNFQQNNPAHPNH